MTPPQDFPTATTSARGQEPRNAQHRPGSHFELTRRPASNLETKPDSYILPRNGSPKEQGELFGRKVEQQQRRQALLERLRSEGAEDLANRLAKCGLAFPLWCTSCGHRHDAETKCNRKWCPVCAPRRANERAAKLRLAIRLMHWPMHITLTVPNLDTTTTGKNFLRAMVKAFVRLRRSKLWRENVTGGAYGVEVTNKGNGWHPHIHTVIDCRWLATKTPEPHRSDDAETRAAKFRSAASELQGAWARATGLDVPASIWIRRCDTGAAAEIMKYAIKSEHVAGLDGEVAPILRMMDDVKLCNTFGDLRGLKVPDDDGPRLTCPNGHSEWTVAKPLEVAAAEATERGRKTRADNERRHDEQKRLEHAWLMERLTAERSRHFQLESTGKIG